MQGTLVLLLFVVTLAVFFWSIYKAIKTQANRYAWGMLPFLLFMVGIFLL